MLTTRRFTLTTVSLLLAISGVTQAQAVDSTSETRRNGWQVLGSSGALIPTGAQRSSLKGAPFSTAQVLYVIHSRVALTTTVGWARSRDLAMTGTPKLSVFTYDVGIESRAPRWLEAKSFSFTPFAGVGAGGRSYDHRGVDLEATHNFAGYAAAGGELGTGRVRLRLEARDYVSGFKPLVGSGKSVTRQDFSLLAGIRLTKKHSSE